MSASSKSATQLALRAYINQIKDSGWISVLCLLLPGIGVTLTTYVPPLIIARMIKDFDAQIPSALSAVTPYLLAFAGVWILGEILWRIALLSMDYVDSRGIASLMNNAMEQLLQKDARFFSDNFAGSLTKKSIGYGRNFERFMDTLCFDISGNVIPISFVIVILWQYSPWFNVVLVGVLVLTFFLILPLIRRRKKLTQDREIASNVMAGNIADVIGNVSAVRAFGNEKIEHSRHQKLASDYTTKARASWDYHALKIDGIVAPLNILINVVGLVLALLITDNANTLAAVFVTFTYFVQTTKVMFEFNRTYRNFESALSEAAEFTELLIEPPRITDVADAPDIRVQSGEVEFRNVTFTHSERDGALFENLDLRIKSGEKVGIIGRSGAGKSTFTNLLLRFIDIDNGKILIDGQDITQVSQRSLRRSIAYVPQDPLLFHRSLRDNISYGKQSASKSDVIAAAKQAHAHEFISQLPDDYNTLVGERGVKLSGGQRQRVAIARAILKDAPILVLDEATSALDSESEKLIQDALKKLMEDRTTIVIAHRLSTIQKMDRIIVMDDGKIVEQGTHSELLKLGGTYAKLWAHQSGGFLED